MIQTEGLTKQFGDNLALDGVVLYFAVKLFQRETILTRWK